MAENFISNCTEVLAPRIDRKTRRSFALRWLTQYKMIRSFCRFTFYDILALICRILSACNACASLRTVARPRWAFNCFCLKSNDKNVRCDTCNTMCEKFSSRCRSNQIVSRKLLFSCLWYWRARRHSGAREAGNCGDELEPILTASRRNDRQK